MGPRTGICEGQASIWDPALPPWVHPTVQLSVAVPATGDMLQCLARRYRVGMAKLVVSGRLVTVGVDGDPPVVRELR